MPSHVIDILLKEENERLEKINEKFYIIDNKSVIIEGDITLKTQFQEEPIVHSVWIELSLEEFLSQTQEQTSAKNSEIQIKGKLASELPFYEEFVGLEVMYKVKENESVANVEIISQSKLKFDTENPISKSRMIEMMQLINHPEIINGKTSFDKPFKNRLNEIIEKANIEFKLAGKLFVINISNPREVLFQLVSNRMLNNPSKKDIGIHLSNDEFGSEFEIINRKMIAICKSNSFVKLSLDEIETYQKDYEFKDSELAEDIDMILTEVFDENVEIIELDIFEP